MLFARLYSFPYLVKLNHLRQKCESPPICCLSLIIHFTLIIKYCLFPSLASLKSPLFSASPMLRMIFGSLESLLSLHPASFFSHPFYTLHSSQKNSSRCSRCTTLTLWPGPAWLNFHCSLPTLYTLHAIY